MNVPFKRRIGVAADDITGANDVGVMFSKNGYRVKVISSAMKPEESDFDDTDVLVINTACRLLSAGDARRLTAEAVLFLRRMDCRLIYIKTCSVFRGNIGAMFDAARDALGAGAVPVVAAYPANGRTTEMGVHLLNGTSVAETHFAHDPVTPLRFSRLDELIGIQSDRPCACFTFDMYGKGERQRLEALKRGAAYVIFDARDQAELRQAAKLIADEPLICGSSAVCEELPGVWGEAGKPLVFAPERAQGAGAVVFSGSLTPQTASQIDHLIRGGIWAERLFSNRLFTQTEREKETQRVLRACMDIVKSGKDVLIYTARDGVSEDEAKRELGLSDIEAGRMVSLAFRSLAVQFGSEAGISRFAVAGGETSDAVASGLGIREMRIWQEIEPGVPLMTSPRPQGGSYALVFKSGSFGSPSFLEKALRALAPHD